MLIAAILASALGFIDGTVTAIALPAMRSTLGAGLAEAQWIHNAYMLMLSALILVGGAIGDRFGLARVFGIGIALFVAASLLCAVAPTALFLIVARGLQGIGAAIMVPGSLAIIARAYPRAERGRAIGIWAAASSLTTALGPIIGGLALTFGGPEMWRWVFAVNLPLGGVAIWLLYSRTQRDVARPGARLDMAGALTATLALLALAWGLTASEDGPDWLWVGIGLAGLALFLRIEARQAVPMMPLTLFNAPVFAAANLLSFTLYSALALMFFFMPMTFIAGWGVSEIEASAAFAPISVFMALISSRAGKLADRIGPAPLILPGSLVVAAGYGVIGWLAPAQDFWQHMLPGFCIIGFGMALVVAPLSAAVMGAVEEHHSGIASGINNAITRLAALLSVAALSGVVAALYQAAGGLASFGIESDTTGHVAAMNVAFRGVAWIASALALLSALIALRLPGGLRR
ncbi:MFS transporter [Aliishimia ponticola]|uniref:MFS transporter n=1 Tax=Aliishimia ponticola TaxID=2499833 RepID=A0A4V3XL18_9RHOB|nr:MFS transporter [Aliishimia ponticola]